jgi:hypothetical protein
MPKELEGLFVMVNEAISLIPGSTDRNMARDGLRWIAQEWPVFEQGTGMLLLSERQAILAALKEGK